MIIHCGPVIPIILAQMLRNSSRRVLVDTISQASRSAASCSLSVDLRSVMAYLNKNSSSRYRAIFEAGGRTKMFVRGVA